MADIDLSALGEAIDTSWGRSSKPVPNVSGFSVKMSLSGQNQLVLNYQTIVNFASEREMLRVKLLESEQSVSNIKSIVDNVKSNYKDKAGKTLKLKEVSATETVEIIGMNVHNPKRTALYRRKCIFELA
jgi:hypothetical protein